MKRRTTKPRTDSARPDVVAGETDLEDFHRAMADVVRLAPDPRGRIRARREVHGAHASTPTHPSPGRPAIDDQGDAGFVSPGVDRRELRRLKRGDYAPGRTLDLHGLTATAAVAKVSRFLDSNRRLHRCVCIVHGRGLHSEGSVAILRTRVRGQLRDHPAVLAYADAPRDDGGTGAVYVLLRK